MDVGMDFLKDQDLVIKCLLAFIAVVTTATAMMTTYIAYRQMEIARTKLQHDLYMKRYEVYIGIDKILSRIGQTGRVGENDLADFHDSTHQAMFIFDAEITSFLSIMLDNVTALQSSQRRVKNSRDSDQRIQAISEAASIKSWLSAQHVSLPKKFTPKIRIISWDPPR
jgi:hypothetical protein